MIRTAALKTRTRRELADLAKNFGVDGWHGMKKDELVQAIAKVQRRLRRKSESSVNTKSKTMSAESQKSATSRASRLAGASSATKRSMTAKGNSNGSEVGSHRNPKGPKGGATGKTGSTLTNGSARVNGNSKNGVVSKKKSGKPAPAPVSAKTARIRSQIRRSRESIQRNRDLSTGTLVAGSAVSHGSTKSKAALPHQDRIILLVRDSFWLQANWEITRSSVERAQSAMAERWHTATPVLRVLMVGDISSNRAETIDRDIPIHGGVDNWYIDVTEPPSRYRVLIGYLADNGDFYTLCRSNIVETPRPGECERLDEHWRDIAEDYERIYSLSGGYETAAGDLKEMFEERLRRTMPVRGDQGQTIGDPTLLRQTKLPFNVDAELIVYGKTVPGASVSVGGRPVKLQPDGSFTVRMELPDKRQVLPVTAESRDGLRQRTTVIAVERNTKVMETVEIEENI